MKQHKIIFIGGGNIAEAIFTKLKSNEVVIIEHNELRLNYISTAYPNLLVRKSLDYITTEDDIVILAIKPQNAKETCINLQKNIGASNILSVMAGITTNTLQNWLNTDKIIRAMPNTPGLQSIGVTGMYFTQTIEDSIRSKITHIFNNIGICYTFKDEDYINKITAVASSSPAYVFYFIESLIDSAIKNFQFSDKDATDITLQVIRGSLEMVQKNRDIAITTLRHNVTSTGGTTAAAINILEENNFKKTINNAEIACYNRAIEIGNSYK